MRLIDEILNDINQAKQKITSVELEIGHASGPSKQIDTLIRAENLLTYCHSRLSDIDPESLRPQGKWEWREEWETHHETRSCDLISCGWYCTKCGIELGEYLTKGTGVNIILDLDIRKPTLAVCPNCGACMKGAGEDA